MDIESILRRLSSVDEDDDIYLQLVLAGPKAAVDLLLPNLGHSDSTWRAMAAKALGWVGRNEAACVVRDFESRTDDEFWMDCENACAVLAEIGSAAMAAVPVLRRWVRRPIYSHMRLHAAVALWSITRNTEEALATARAWIGDEDKWMKVWGAELLGHLGPAARPMEADLRSLAEDEDYHIREQATEALAKIVSAE